MPASDMTGYKAPGRQSWRIEVWHLVSGTPTLDRTWTPASPGPLKGEMSFEWASPGTCVSAQLTVDTNLDWPQFDYGIRLYLGGISECLWSGVLMDDPDGKRTPQDSSYTLNFQGWHVINTDGLVANGWSTVTGWFEGLATYLSVPAAQRGDTWGSYLARGTATDGLAAWGVRGNAKSVAARPSDGVRATVDVGELLDVTSTGRVTAPYITETLADPGQPWATLQAYRTRPAWTPRKAATASSDGLTSQTVSQVAPATGTDPAPYQLTNQAQGWYSRVYNLPALVGGSAGNPNVQNATYQNISFRQRFSAYMGSVSSSYSARVQFAVFLSTSTVLASGAILGSYSAGTAYIDPTLDTNVIKSSVQVQNFLIDLPGNGVSVWLAAAEDLLNTVRTDINGGNYYLHFGVLVNSPQYNGTAMSPSMSYIVIYANELTRKNLSGSIPNANLPGGWNMPFWAGPTWQARYPGVLVPPYTASNLPAPGGGTAAADGANARLVISNSEFSTQLQIGALPWGHGG